MSCVQQQRWNLHAIREIMREHGILSKELKHPVMCSDKIFEAVLIEINDEDTSIPALHAPCNELQKSGEESVLYGFRDGFRVALQYCLQPKR